MIRILIVDDEPQILRALRINLQAGQYEVHTAADGAEALAAWPRSTRPDLVILDLGLPDIDGVEVIRNLRAWTPVPIVVLSGRADSRDKVDALDAGADDYVTKPFSVDELLARIRAVTRRRVMPGAAIRRAIGQVRRRPRQPPVTGDDGAVVHLTPIEWQLAGSARRRTRANCSATASFCSKSGGRPTSPRPSICVSTWPSYGASSRRTRRGRGISSPNPGMGYRFQP